MFRYIGDKETQREREMRRRNAARYRYYDD